MSWLLQIGGALLVLAVAQDVFFTVLFPSSGRGILRRPLTHGVWWIFRVVGRLATGRRRRDLLSYSGPVQIVVGLGAWFALMLVGWAMIYRPALGTEIVAASGPTDVGWSTAFYYSGYALTTLGVGDLVARTGGYRLLTVLEAATGFIVLTMVITYFLSVYSTLTDRNAFAQGLHQRTGGSDDPAQLIARAADGGELPDMPQRLASMAAQLRTMYQTHHFYPVLRYFHYRDPFYALPRVLLTVLDLATLLRTALDAECHRRVVYSVSLDELRRAAIALTNNLVPDGAPAPPSADDVATWRRRYLAARGELAEHGLALRADDEQGAAEYVALRAEWDRSVRRLAEIMLYEWETIDEAGADGEAA